MHRVLRTVFGGDRPAQRAFARTRAALAGALILAAAGVTQPAAQDGESITVIIGDDETIREVADRYLSDPDLWPEILRSSGVESITDLRPGMELRIPVSEITTASQALIEALGQIQRANQAGAQVFAPDEIGRAVDFHEQALEKRLARQWVETRDLAISSYDEATEAIEISEAHRDQTAEALVTDRVGNVEGQRPEDLSWRDLQLRAILVEEEKVRTLSASTAQITFRDASRLRLNANSNAIIRQMRFDPLTRREEAKVSLVEGDFYALLASDEADRTRFNVEIPNVNAVIDSGNFWVSNAADQAKFANYDERPVAVAAAGETVTLGKNEGTIVDQGAAPREKLAVLAAPDLTEPIDRAAVHTPTPALAWSPVAGAAGYWLEISTDQNFDRIVGNEFGVPGPPHTTRPLDTGEYFWRVSALDGFGLPGARSETSSFLVSPDIVPPFLTIESPVPGAIFREALLEVRGETEPGAAVRVNGAAAAVEPGGAYSAEIEMTAGSNPVTVTAFDAAGNETGLDRSVVYMPDAESIIAFDPGLRRLAPDHFIANSDVISLRGTTTANAEIEVRVAGEVRASVVSDEDGAFRINAPVAQDEGALDLVVVAPSGFATVEAFAVTVDRVPPDVVLDTFPPRLTSDAALRISGNTEPQALVTLNGQELALVDGRFDHTLALLPGENIVELIATDRAGNVKVDRSIVVVDADPPELLAAEGSPGVSGGRTGLAINVLASDATGLAKAAPFLVIAGDQRFSGHLRYNRAAQSYQGFVLIPEDVLPAARLARIELQDDAGNSRVFDIQ